MHIIKIMTFKCRKLNKEINANVQSDMFVCMYADIIFLLFVSL